MQKLTSIICSLIFLTVVLLPLLSAIENAIDFHCEYYHTEQSN
ncbi:MAG: hypothetical protein V2B14_01730 [bacterium]